MTERRAFSSKYYSGHVPGTGGSVSTPGWKLIPEFPDYEMDPQGFIRPVPGKHKSITVSWNGPYVRLYKKGKLYTKRLTTLHEQTYPFVAQRITW